VFSVPFHKLSQWMTYSLMEPLQKILGVEIEGVEQMTGERRLSAIFFPFCPFSRLVFCLAFGYCSLIQRSGLGWISLRLVV
jgi:hypothetical protein